MPAMGTAAAPEMNRTSITATSASAPLTPGDQEVLANVEAAIDQGREVKEWLDAERTSRIWMNRFPIARELHYPDLNFGFLMDANLRSGTLPVAGVCQDQLFAWPKAPAGCRQDLVKVRARLRDFIFHRFMGITHEESWTRAEGLGSGRRNPDSRQLVDGWGYEQVFYKLKGTGEVGRFPDNQQRCIVPLEEIGTKYAWIVFKVDIFHLNAPVNLLGLANGPRLTVSLQQPVYTVMTPDYLVDQEDPEPGVVGKYGYGYSVIPNPTYKSLLAVGPSSLTHTIERLTFRLLKTGEMRAHMDYVMPQPQRVLNLDPVGWSFGAADRLSFGAASKVFGPLKSMLQNLQDRMDPVFMGMRILDTMTAGISSSEFSLDKDQLLKSIMMLHFVECLKMFNLASSRFAFIRDGTDSVPPKEG